MPFQPYINSRTLCIGRNQQIFLRMLTNCMEEVGLTLPLGMDEINILMPDDYNESQRWQMLISLHRNGLITFNPVTGRIVDLNLGLLDHVIRALKRNHCCIYDYYQEPYENFLKTWDRINGRSVISHAPKKKGYRWSKTRVKVPVEPTHFA